MDKILEQILWTQSETYNSKEMHKTIRGIVKTIPGCVVHEDNGNIYVTKGVADAYNCIVSHTDTVHRIIAKKDYKVVQMEDRVFAYDKGKGKATGIGGDDKCGIAICLQALMQLDVLKVAFFRDEEVGGLGSQEADMEWFDNCNYVLQCDRKGNSGFVQEIYGEIMFDEAFEEAVGPIIDTYGYATVSGMFTDVYQLVCNGLQVACANIECGYYNPHSDNEYIVLEDYERCKKMVLHILERVNDRYEVDRDYGDRYAGYGEYKWTETGDKYMDHCWGCNEYKIIDETEMVCDTCMEHCMKEVHVKKPAELFPEGKW